MNAAGQPIVSSDSEHHRSDGNDSDGSMLNLKEDLKPISYYIKDRERMLKEMFRCVRGHKLQAILPDALKVTLIESHHSGYDQTYQKIALSRTMQKLTRITIHLFFLINIFSTNLNSLKQVRLIIDPCFRLIYIIDQILEQHRIQYRRKLSWISFREVFV